MAKKLTPTKKKQTRVSKKYSIEIIYNGIKQIKKVDHISEALMFVTPVELCTDVYFNIKQGKTLIERHLSLVQAKRLLQSEDIRNIFINNILV